MAAALGCCGGQPLPTIKKGADELTHWSAPQPPAPVFVLLYSSADNVAAKAPAQFPAHKARLDDFHARGELLMDRHVRQPARGGLDGHLPLQASRGGLRRGRPVRPQRRGQRMGDPPVERDIPRWAITYVARSCAAGAGRSIDQNSVRMNLPSYSLVRYYFRNETSRSLPPEPPMPDQPVAAPRPGPASRGTGSPAGTVGAGQGIPGARAYGEAGLLVVPGDAGWLPPPEPSEAELAGCWPDPDVDPPDGDDAWLADLAGGQLDALAAELAAARPPAAAESVGAGFIHRRAAAGITAGEPGWQPPYAAPRAADPAAGFAAGAPLDLAAAGPVLAQFAQDALDGGLAKLSDDELVGLLCAARRLTSWQAATELSAVAELDARRRRAAAAAAARNRRPAARAAATAGTASPDPAATGTAATGNAGTGTASSGTAGSNTARNTAAGTGKAEAGTGKAEAGTGKAEAGTGKAEAGTGKAEAGTKAPATPRCPAANSPPPTRSPPTPGSARSPAPSKPTAPPGRSTSSAPKCSSPSCSARTPRSARARTRRPRAPAPKDQPAWAASST